MSTSQNNYPKLHNATWPGVVGKGEGSEPYFSLETMLDLTAAAEVDGVQFDGVDLFLFDPHVSIDSSEEDLKRLAGQVTSRNLEIGSVVAPVWGPTGGGSAMGGGEDRKKFLAQVTKACRIARRLRELGVRPSGIVRIDSAVDPGSWAADPEGNQARIAETFRQACDIAEEYGERLAAEGEICWGGMHSWRRMVQLLEMVNRPATLGFQADMAHTFLYLLGYNAPEDAMVSETVDWKSPEFEDAYRQLCARLRPWTIDLHIAQNDGTVKGAGSHDKTGRHCLPKDPGGKLDITRLAGHWLRDERQELTRSIRHLCWDGCMFSNETMKKPETWNEILGAMQSVREAHGWRE